MKEKKLLIVIATGFIAGCIQISIIIGLLVFPKILFNATETNTFSENGIKQESASKDDSQYIKGDSSSFFKKRQSDKNGSSKEIIIYNGITVDEGIKSNENINNKAVQLTKNAASDREKAKILYTWIGSNIKYDDAKADKVLNENYERDMPESGAICTFEKRSGICFDKACLYVAMSRAIGLNVRLIGGQAVDESGQSVGHAWNQAYLKEENKWINIDSTFYQGGDYYFDSEFFGNHKVDEIAGEW